MPQYLLLLHETPADYADIAPEEMQRIVERYSAWSRQLAEEGRMVAGVKLRDEGGRHIRRGRDAIVVHDGPYSESKDVVGGYFIVNADSYDAAVAIAGDCPHMANGWVEVREVEIS